MAIPKDILKIPRPSSTRVKATSKYTRTKKVDISKFADVYFFCPSVK